MARPALPPRLLPARLLLPCLLLPIAACATLAPAPQVSLSAPPATPAAAPAGPVLAEEWTAFLATARPGDARPLPGPGGAPVTVTAGGRYLAATGRECRHFRVNAAAPAPSAAAAVTPSAAGAAEGASRVACATAAGWQAVRPVVSTSVEG